MTTQAHTDGVTASGNSPNVSVIVPFYNSELHLTACIESLRAQESVGGNFEMILIDNRSTDGSAAIAAGYPQLIVLEEPSPGAYAARNAGVRRARAPLIAFTDADCVVDSNWLRSICEGMEDPEVGMLLGHCRYPADASLPLRLLGAYENAKTDYVISGCPSRNHFAYANNMAVRTSVFDEIGLFEEWERAADSELLHRMAVRRPDLRVSYLESMRVTHLEFIRARDRVARLRLYTRTNTKIESFEELSARHRFGLFLRMLRPRPRR
jgi:glycosyltransferase involved in cell wall biosynthesis